MSEKKNPIEIVVKMPVGTTGGFFQFEPVRDEAGLVNLTDLWRRRSIATPLVLVGLRASTAPLPPGVASTGYVDSIADIYDGHSVLLTPALIGGGVKTKVFEAFAHGSAVIGNALTFEAMALDDYPLTIDDEARLVELISHPEQNRDLFLRAAAHGAAYLKRRHDPAVFADHWRDAMRPPVRPERAEAG